MEYVTLNNGIKMPKLGYGVYQTAPEDTKRCVLDAIETGHRQIVFPSYILLKQSVCHESEKAGSPVRICDGAMLLKLRHSGIYRKRLSFPDIGCLTA